MLATSDPDRIDSAFDDDRLVDHAGLLLPATLAGRLGLLELADAQLDLGDAATRTLRRRYFALAGRLTHSARRWTLHLPKRWPWAGQWAAALARLRALPLPA